MFWIKFCYGLSVLSCLDIRSHWRCNYLPWCWMHGKFPAYGSISYVAGPWSTRCLQLGKHVFSWCVKQVVTREAQTFLSASCLASVLQINLLVSSPPSLQRKAENILHFINKNVAMAEWGWWWLHPFKISKKKNLTIKFLFFLICFS